MADSSRHKLSCLMSKEASGYPQKPTCAAGLAGRLARTPLGCRKGACRGVTLAIDPFMASWNHPLSQCRAAICFLAPVGFTSEQLWWKTHVPATPPSLCHMPVPTPKAVLSRLVLELLVVNWCHQKGG